MEKTPMDKRGLPFIVAPFTLEQTERLNNWQNDCRVHPFTCGNCREVLVATSDGWECPSCDYTQEWAHPFMVEDPAKMVVEFPANKGDDADG